MIRRDKTNYYLDIAETVSKRGTCLKRNYGVVIVKNDEIISTGYDGAPRGRVNCIDLGYCIRINLKIPAEQQYEMCRSVHAAVNAIISASRQNMIGSILYFACHNIKSVENCDRVEPCLICKKYIINAGIKSVVMRKTNDIYEIFYVQNWMKNEKYL